MEKLIQSGDELVQWFFEVNSDNNKERGKDRAMKGVYVDGIVRKDILTSDRQGTMIADGSVQTIQFENIGGGVYRAFIEYI